MPAKNQATIRRMRDLPTSLGESDLVGFDPLQVVLAADLEPSLIKTLLMAPFRIIGAVLRVVRRPLTLFVLVAGTFIGYLLTPWGAELRAKILAGAGLGERPVGGDAAIEGGWAPTVVDADAVAAPADTDTVRIEPAVDTEVAAGPGTDGTGGESDTPR